MSGRSLPSRLRLLVQAYICLLRVHSREKTHPLQQIYAELVLPWREDSREVEPDDPLIARVEWAVRRAAIWQGRRTVCLHKSIATYSLLRAYRARPRLIIGVTSRPFSSHSWVEIDGTPVGDPEMAGRHYHYRPVMRLPRLTPAAE